MYLAQVSDRHNDCVIAYEMAPCSFGNLHPAD